MDFKVHISGLAHGKYEYEFSVNGSLFREFGNQQIIDSNVLVRCTLEKGSGWMNVSLNGEGSVTVECNRCLEEMAVPISFEESLAVRFAKFGEDTEEAEEFLIVDPSETEIDLKQFIYDCICVSIPLTTVHPKGKCNTEMLQRLKNLQADEDTGQEDKDVYSPFSGLKDLLKNKEK